MSDTIYQRIYYKNKTKTQICTLFITDLLATRHPDVHKPYLARLPCDEGGNHTKLELLSKKMRQCIKSPWTLNQAEFWPYALSIMI